MVTSPSGEGVIIIGGWNENTKKYSKALLELKGSPLEWVPLKQTLRYRRKDHVAVAIPRELVFQGSGIERVGYTRADSF